LEELVGWKYGSGRKLVQRITQTSLGFLLLQSTICSRTDIPESCWARGTGFWADNEARVQIAPSGMMKKRKDGFVTFLTPLRRWCVALVIVGISSEFFRLMSLIVSFVSPAAPPSTGRDATKTPSTN
jgi:hypothetical protein